MAGAESVLGEVLASGLPAVLDADALNVAADPGWQWPAGRARVLTPHPGEAARLLGSTTAEVQSNRVGAARDLAARTCSVVVLKGAGTLVASPDGSLAINPTGGPALATAGSGDVLAGVVGALMARGIAPFEAAYAAAYAHGLAGDLAAERLTEHSVGASDVLDALPDAIRRITEPTA